MKDKERRNALLLYLFSLGYSSCMCIFFPIPLIIFFLYFPPYSLFSRVPLHDLCLHSLFCFIELLFSLFFIYTIFELLLCCYHNTSLSYIYFYLALNSYKLHSFLCLEFVFPISFFLSCLMLLSLSCYFFLHVFVIVILISKYFLIWVCSLVLSCCYYLFAIFIFILLLLYLVPILYYQSHCLILVSFYFPPFLFLVSSSFITSLILLLSSLPCLISLTLSLFLSSSSSSFIFVFFVFFASDDLYSLLPDHR
jgi:hypothetical protein